MFLKLKDRNLEEFSQRFSEKIFNLDGQMLYHKLPARVCFTKCCEKRFYTISEKVKADLDIRS